MAKRFDFRKVKSKDLWLGILAIGLILAFLNLLLKVVSGESLPYDIELIKFIHTFQSEALTQLMLLVTYLGEWQLVALLAVLIGLGFLVNNKKSYLYSLILSVGIGEVIIWAIKNLVERARPEVIHHIMAETSSSFPSRTPRKRRS